MSTLRTATVAAVALVGTLLLPTPANGGGAAAGTDDRTRVIADCEHAKVEPRRVVAACGDTNEWAFIKSYGSWKKKEAWGNGRIHMNDCDPNCAAGTVRSYQATFRFHRVVETARFGPLFTRLGVTYIKGGEEHNTELRLPRRPITTG